MLPLLSLKHNQDAVGAPIIREHEFRDIVVVIADLLKGYDFDYVAVCKFIQAYPRLEKDKSEQDIELTKTVYQTVFELARKKNPEWCRILTENNDSSGQPITREADENSTSDMRKALSRFCKLGRFEQEFKEYMDKEKTKYAIETVEAFKESNEFQRLTIDSFKILQNMKKIAEKFAMEVDPDLLQREEGTDDDDNLNPFELLEKDESEEEETAHSETLASIVRILRESTNRLARLFFIDDDNLVAQFEKVYGKNGDDFSPAENQAYESLLDYWVTDDQIVLDSSLHSQTVDLTQVEPGCDILMRELGIEYEMGRSSDEELNAAIRMTILNGPLLTTGESAGGKLGRDGIPAIVALAKRVKNNV